MRSRRNADPNPSSSRLPRLLIPGSGIVYSDRLSGCPIWPPFGRSADLGDFEREVDRDVRTIALDDEGGEARRPIGEQAGRQARRHKASAVNFPSMTRRYLPLTELEWDSVFLGYCLS